MSAGKICTRVVATVSPREMVRVAARRMAENSVGTLVVVESSALMRPIGIITDRDIAIRCVGENLDPNSTPVERLMTSPVVSVDEFTSIEDSLARMASVATRRLIVTGPEGKLVGILSLDDVLGLITDETRAVGRLLRKQGPHLASAPGRP